MLKFQKLLIFTAEMDFEKIKYLFDTQVLNLKKVLQ
jgi:hypothetical protein